jgi:toxin ParE1/3/4
VADFRLSERAEHDLIEIYDYTEETFGAYQAEAYHAGLERTFDLLASFHRIGRAAKRHARTSCRFDPSANGVNRIDLARCSACQAPHDL